MKTGQELGPCGGREQCSRGGSLTPANQLRPLGSDCKARPQGPKARGVPCCVGTPRGAEGAYGQYPLGKIVEWSPWATPRALRALGHSMEPGILPESSAWMLSGHAMASQALPAFWPPPESAPRASVVLIHCLCPPCALRVPRALPQEVGTAGGSCEGPGEGATAGGPPTGQAHVHHFAGLSRPPKPAPELLLAM